MEQKRSSPVTLLLILLLAAFFILSVRYGSVDLSLQDMYSAMHKLISGGSAMTLYERIFLTLRLPRAVLCLFVGASLAAGGVLMQTLFRNPIVEPGLVGASSGAAFGAALFLVVGNTLQLNAGEWALPLAACGGALLSSALVFMLSGSGGKKKNSITAMLLTGIAINALFMSGVGFLSYIARDPQARSVTFWGLGTLSGANWHSVIIVSISTVICICIAIYAARSLDVFILGEETAVLLGIRIERFKRKVLFINIVMIAVATAFTGVISFVGLIVPHLLRICGIRNTRPLLINSALLGAVMLSITDLVSRMALRPAELPIGIVTTIIGVPVFIILLRSRDYFF